MTSFDPTAEFSAIREGVAQVCAGFPGAYWRDLDARYTGAGGDAAKPWIRAAHLDHIDGGAQTGEAWYRVFVTGFKEQKNTAGYCDTLLQAGQGCKVVPDPRGGQEQGGHFAPVAAADPQEAEPGRCRADANRPLHF